MKRREDRRAAVPGEIFYVPPGRMCTVLLGRDEPEGGCCEVFTKTEGEAGQWICISCCEPLANNFEKDSHCMGPAPKKSKLVGDPPDGAPNARHVLAWRSFTSGKVEAP